MTKTILNLIMSMVITSLSINLFAQQPNWEDLQKEGNALLIQGHYAKAEAVLLECIQLQNKVLKKTDYRLKASRSFLRICYAQLNLRDKHEALILEELELSKSFGNESSEFSSALLDASSFYVTVLKNIEKAEPYINQHLSISRQTYQKNKMFEQAHTLTLKLAATWYDGFNLKEKSKSLLQEALQILETDLKKRIKNPELYQYNLMQRGEICMQLGDKEKASLLLQERINLIESIHGNNSQPYRDAVTFKRALMDKEIDVKIISENLKALNKTSPEYLSNLVLKAGALIAKDNYRDAEPLLVEILTLSEKVYGQIPELLQTELFNLGFCQLKIEKYTDAEISFNNSFTQTQKMINESLPLLSEEEKKNFTTTRLFQQFELFKPVVITYHFQSPSLAGQLFNNQIFTKAILLSASQKMRERIMRSDDTNLKNDFLLWKSKKQELLNAYKLSLKEQVNSGIDIKKLESEANTLEKNLSTRSEDFKGINEKSIIKWQDIQQQLKDNEAVVEIVRSSYNRNYNTNPLQDTVVYMALVITKKSQNPAVVMLSDGRSLETRLGRYYANAMKAKLEDKQSYEYYWKPIAEHLQNVLPPGVKQTIYLSSDGVYNNINVNTLYNPTTNKFVQDEYSIRLLTNSKDLMLPTPVKGNNSAELFGYPDYQAALNNPQHTSSNVSTYEQFQTGIIEKFLIGEGIPQLPGTKKEIEQIQSTLSSKGVPHNSYLGAIATETKVKNLQSPRVLHIATHGYFTDTGNSSVNQPNSSLNQNPLVRSGLLLAGSANAFSKNQVTSGDDGILTAYEAMNLNLDATDLVVLSACETGSGEIVNGEGVYGLQRAFQVAGAKAVIMSLWKVDDEATQNLMIRFYKLWLESGNKRTAFESAQQSIRSDFPHPYYWGPFILIGD